MKKWLAICLTIVLLGGLTLTGCKEKQSIGKPHTHDHENEVTLCGLCGEVKGTDKCCAEGIALCDNCKLHKDSPLCCNKAIRGEKDILLCRKCGEVCFTEKCCPKSGAPEKCAECGLHKDSPGCCRIDPDVRNPSEVDEKHDGEHHT